MIFSYLVSTILQHFSVVDRSITMHIDSATDVKPGTLRIPPNPVLLTSLFLGNAILMQCSWYAWLYHTCLWYKTIARLVLSTNLHISFDLVAGMGWILLDTLIIQSNVTCTSDVSGKHDRKNSRYSNSQCGAITICLTRTMFQ